MQFGLLSYRTFNLGDNIQSIAAQPFLPRVDRYVDREALDEISCEDGERLKLIMNGWFCIRPDKWPPAPPVEPLLISFHVTDIPQGARSLRPRREFAGSPRVLQYLRQHGPVGARDHGTLTWLRSLDVESYFSGCLTLTLDAPPGCRREDFVVLNEVPDGVAARIAGSSRRPLRRTAHLDFITIDPLARFRRAASLIDLYARAACVVTTRLHCALPCLGMGTPVLLIDGTHDQSRFSGLKELVHCASAERFVAGEVDYDIDDPPANPGTHAGLRADLTRRIRDFVAGGEQTKPVSSPSVLLRLRERIARWL
jgi:hypothetical protein